MSRAFRRLVKIILLNYWGVQTHEQAAYFFTRESSPYFLCARLVFLLDRGITPVQLEHGFLGLAGLAWQANFLSTIPFLRVFICEGCGHTKRMPQSHWRESLSRYCRRANDVSVKFIYLICLKQRLRREEKRYSFSQGRALYVSVTFRNLHAQPQPTFNFDFDLFFFSTTVHVENPSVEKSILTIENLHFSYLCGAVLTFSPTPRRRPTDL